MQAFLDLYRSVVERKHRSAVHEFPDRRGDVELTSEVKSR